jgi:S-adenosylmethionine decarboxylase
LDLSAGKHLIVDLYECESDLLFDRIALVRFLDELPGRIGMSILRGAAVYRIAFPKCCIEDEGLSGTAIICESHIAAHTFPRRKFVEMDVSSCKDFNEKEVIKIIEGAFGAKMSDVQIVRRGRLAHYLKTEG